ncbi:hypothetical protein BBJ28_00011496 [Nothophytophthora sp. Chile5]|nr:hypothetical protein BBJ28_00011496 [Nothophytophthora sp. Chile5]
MIKNATAVQQRSSRESGAAKTLSDAAEQDILEWLVVLPSQGVPVLANVLELAASEVAAMCDYSRIAFTASPTWVTAFLGCHSLSLRTKLRRGQFTPEDSARVANKLAATLRQRIIHDGVVTVFNANQTAGFFEYVAKHTMDERYETTVWVKSDNKSKERLTAILLADSTCLKYDPRVVSKMRPSSYEKTRVDSARLYNGFNRRLRPSIEAGFTHCCQPADMSWNKPLKDRMRAAWTDYLQAECSKIMTPQEGEEPKL